MLIDTTIFYSGFFVKAKRQISEPIESVPDAVDKHARYISEIAT